MVKYIVTVKINNKKLWQYLQQKRKKKEQVIPYKLLFIHKLLFIIICNYFTI